MGIDINNYQNCAVVDGGADLDEAGSGETVTVTAGETPDGKYFAGWESSTGTVIFADANAKTTTFAMIDSDVTITAIFADKTVLEEINFTVTPVHKSLEGIVSPAFYMTPPMDDYLNNSIYINEGSETGATWNTYAHEGIPGHMYQFVYFLSNDPEPIRTLLNFSGYQEGWATYVEMMSFDYFDGYHNAGDAIYIRSIDLK